MNQNPMIQNPMNQNPLNQNPMNQNPIIQNPMNQNPFFPKNNIEITKDELLKSDPNSPEIITIKSIIKSIFSNSQYIESNEFPDLTANQEIPPAFFFKGMMLFTNQSQLRKFIIKKYNMNTFVSFLNETIEKQINLSTRSRIFFECKNIFHTLIVASIIWIVENHIPSNNKLQIFEHVSEFLGIPKGIFTRAELIPSQVEKLDFIYFQKHRIINLANQLYSKAINEESDSMLLFNNIFDLIHKILQVKLRINFFNQSYPFFLTNLDLNQKEEFLDVLLLPNKDVIIQFSSLIPALSNIEIQCSDLIPEKVTNPSVKYVRIISTTNTLNLGKPAFYKVL